LDANLNNGFKKITIHDTGLGRSKRNLASIGLGLHLQQAHDNSYSRIYSSSASIWPGWIVPEATQDQSRQALIAKNSLSLEEGSSLGGDESARQQDHCFAERA
jgi:hypothetical protein